MFDIGWQEIFIIGILALIVVGPKDLPQAVRTITQWIRKARGLAREFQGGINEMVREAELDDIKNQIMDAKSLDLQSELEKNIDPDGEIAKNLNMDPDALDDEAEGMKTPEDGPEILNQPEPQKSIPVSGAEVSPLDDDVMPAAEEPAPATEQPAADKAEMDKQA